MRRHTKIVEKDGDPWAKFPWVQTNFDGVKSERWVRSYAMWGAIQFQLGTSGMGAFSKLVELRAATAAFNESVLADHKSVTRKTQAMIETNVSRGEMDVGFLKVVRDLSAITLTVVAAPIAAAGVAAGGVSAGVLGTSALGLGTALTGVGEYQESGDLGRAAVKASANLICGVLGFAKMPALAIQAEGKVKMALAILQVKTEAVSAAGLALMDGEDALGVIRKTVVAAAGPPLAGKLWNVIEERKGLSFLAKVVTKDSPLYTAAVGKVLDLAGGGRPVELLKAIRPMFEQTLRRKAIFNAIEASHATSDTAWIQEKVLRRSYGPTL